MTVPQKEAQTEADRELVQPPHELELNDSQTASEYVNLSMAVLQVIVRN